MFAPGYRRDAVKRFNLSRSLGALAIGAVMTASIAGSAIAEPHGHGWQHDRWHGHDWHGDRGYYQDNTGAVIGGALLGLGVGALLGSTLAPPPQAYYAPPPVYYPPPPQQYYNAPPPPVYYGY